MSNDIFESDDFPSERRRHAVRTGYNTGKKIIKKRVCLINGKRTLVLYIKENGKKYIEVNGVKYRYQGMSPQKKGFRRYIRIKDIFSYSSRFGRVSNFIDLPPDPTVKPVPPPRKEKPIRVDNSAKEYLRKHE